MEGGSDGRGERDLDVASSTLHGLLRKLGAGLDLLPNTSLVHTRLKGVLAGLRADGDEPRQLEALQTLCELLSIGTEESLVTFSVDTFVPLLVNLMYAEHSPDMMLLAARALTQLADVIPSACGAIVHYGAVSCFCARLLTIEYIDLAEQSLQALEKLSHEHGAACLQAGGLIAVLSYLDFFPTGVQRVAVQTAANMCRHVTADTFPVVTDAVPILSNLLQHEDSKLVESASIALTRMTEVCARNPEHLETICSHGLVQQAARLVSPLGGASLNPSTYTGMLRLLSTMCAGSSNVREMLLQSGVCSTVRHVLSTSGVISASAASPASPGWMSSEQLQEAVTLADEMLPPLPSVNRNLDTEDEPGASGAPVSFSTAPELLVTYGEELLSLLVQVAGSSVGVQSRLRCVSCVTKLLHYTREEDIERLLDQRVHACFLAGLLTSRDHAIVYAGLRAVDATLEKLSSAVALFVREGVVHRVHQLAAQASAAPPSGEGGSPTRSATRTPTARDQRLKAAREAARLCEFYGEAFAEAQKDSASESLRQLSAWAGKLAQPDEAKRATAVSEIFDLLLSADGISTFEFLEAGAVSSLVNHLCCARDVTAEILEARLRGLLEAAQRVGPGGQTAGVALVRLLQECLAVLEVFPVLHSAGPRNLGDRATSLAALNRPFKLRLTRAASESGVRDYSANVVLVEPLASLTAVENFLWPRIRRMEGAMARGIHHPGGGEHASTPPVESAARGERDDGADQSRQQQPEGRDRAMSEDLLEPLEGVDDVDRSLSGAASGSEFDGGSERLLEEDEEDEDEDEDDEDEDEDEEDDDDDDEEEPVPSRAGAMRGIAEGLATASTAAPSAAGASQASPGQPTAAQIVAGGAGPRLTFTLNGAPIDPTTTIFQAVHQLAAQQAQAQEAYGVEDASPEQTLWERVHSLTYRLTSSDTSMSESDAPQKDAEELPKDPELGPLLAPIAPLLCGRFAGSVPAPGSPKEVVLMITLLRSVMGRLAPRLCPPGQGDGKAAMSVPPPEEFLSAKLTSKLVRQLQETLILCSGGLPKWCTELCCASPFLFPFECRRQLFQCTAFGLSRALHRLQQQEPNGSSGGGDFRELAPVRLQRQKVRVSRSQILDSAARVLELYGSQRSLLEVEFFGEVGTGTGPTLEFYTLLSRELQLRTLGLWRTEPAPTGAEKDAAELVFAPSGLFPAPLPPGEEESKANKLLEYFRLAGRTVAKALHDGRLLDLPLAPAFWRLVQGKPVDMYDLRDVDPALGKVLFDLDGVCKRRAELEVSDAPASDIEALTLNGATVDCLSLDFTCPGYPSYELKEGGASVDVTVWNLPEYVAAVRDAVIGKGVARQVETFRQGFSEVFKPDLLSMFVDTELDVLVCGCGERWDPEMLAENIKFDHGYTAQSTHIKHLLDILSSLSPEDKQRFLRFVTGAPRLPPGGLAALTPKLTIVRKHPSNSTPQGSPMPGSSPMTGASPILTQFSPGSPGSLDMASTAADGDLPSVMTCANYLKLPPYSSQEIMRERLLFAVREGISSFDLS